MTKPVYVTTGTGNSGIYHLDPDCPRLSSALNINKYSSDNKMPDWEPCEWCIDGDKDPQQQSVGTERDSE